MITYFEKLMIFFVLLCCLYASYTDIKWKKIRNIHTYGLLIIGLIGQFILVSERIIDLYRVSTIFLGGLGVGFLMYYLNVWSAGDAKLFWGVSAAIPASLYSAVNFTEFPPFILVVNTFVPYFLVIGIYLLLKIKWREIRKAFSKTFNPIFLLKFAFSFTCLMGFSFFISSLIPYKLNYFYYLLLFLLLFSFFNRYIKQKNQKYFFILFFPVTIFFIKSKPIFYLEIILITYILFLLFRFFVLSLINYKLIKEIEVADLKKGMIPAEMIVRDRDGSCKKQSIDFTSFFSFTQCPRKSEVIMKIKPEGLSQEDIEKLKHLAKSGAFKEFNNRVKIQHSIPFAPIITIGAILTVLFKGAIIFNAIQKW